MKSDKKGNPEKQDQLLRAGSAAVWVTGGLYNPAETEVHYLHLERKTRRLICAVLF